MRRSGAVTTSCSARGWSRRMRLAESARVLAMIALMIGANAQADEPKYGKVETFQPGKKYTCVPTADHKGWDCNEIAPADAAGKHGSNAPPAETTPLAPAARAPEPMPSPPASTPAAPPASAPAPDRPKSSALPAYLRAGSPGGTPSTAPAPPAPVSSPAPAPAPAAPPAAEPAAPARAPESPAPARTTA